MKSVLERTFSLAALVLLAAIPATVAQGQMTAPPPSPGIGADGYWHFPPLLEQGTNLYKGQDGGLYGHGVNIEPAEYQKQRMQVLDDWVVDPVTGAPTSIINSPLSRRIRPLDGQGKPVLRLDAKGNATTNGRTVMLSIGMGEASKIFRRFKELSDANELKGKKVALVDGAQEGLDAQMISDKASPAWKVMDERLKAAGLTPLQVQVVWIEEADMHPKDDFSAEMEQFRNELQGIVLIAQERFPNLRLAFISTPPYGGYAKTGPLTEPRAYESAFAARKLMQDQIKGDPKLNFHPGRGKVVAPLVLWGPYLWANGTTPRKWDHMIWEPKDAGADGAQISASGVDNLATEMMHWFLNMDSATPWFQDIAAQREAAAGAAGDGH